MPLSTEYNVLIVDAIAAIRMTTPQDFDAVCAELHKIRTTKNLNTLRFDPRFQSPLESIAEFLMQPNCYVAAKDENNFKNLVKTEIQRGIDRFQRMSTAEKQAYIDTQRAADLRRCANQLTIENAQPRRSRDRDVMIRTAQWEDEDFLALTEQTLTNRALGFMELTLFPIYSVAMGLFALFQMNNPLAFVAIIACNLVVMPYLAFDYLKERIKDYTGRVFPFFYRSETEEELRITEQETMEFHNL